MDELEKDSANPSRTTKGTGPRSGSRAEGTPSTHPSGSAPDPASSTTASSPPFVSDALRASPLARSPPSNPYGSPKSPITGSPPPEDFARRSPPSSPYGSPKSPITGSPPPEDFVRRPQGSESPRFATQSDSYQTDDISNRAAGFRPDSVSGEDLLNVRGEALTLAMVLAHKDVNPPISVGLFGDWGSGKSFFMSEMRSLPIKLIY